METKIIRRSAALRATALTFSILLTLNSFFLDTQTASAAKAPLKQKTLSISSSSGDKGYLKVPVILKAAGGSGLGKISFKVKTGPCIYVSSKAAAPSGVGLYTTSTSPTFCTVYATKAGDKKYSSTISKSKVIYFDHFTGYYKNLTVKGLIPMELVEWNKTEGRLSTPESGSFFNELVKASQESSVRYAPYWATLNTFWQQRLNALNATDSYYEAKFEDLAYRGMSNSGAAQLLGSKFLIQKNLKAICQSQISKTLANYQRDMDSIYK